MKTAPRFPRAFVPALVAVAATAAADPPDLTSAMEPLCNPNASRWTASQPLARAATSIGVCDGKIFVSGGDWDDNLGPCPIFAVDPYSGAYVKEYESGTEAIDYFRIGSDGSLYAPSVDPREGHANECSVARRKPDGTWTKLNAPNRWIRYSSSENAAYGTHNWDFAIWKGKIFTAGYGLGVGTELATTRLSDATPQINDANRTYASQYGGTFQQSRRFYAFLPFEDDLFCYPLNYAVFQANNFRVWDFEEWRFDESASRFVCQTNAAANVVPGLSRSDMPFLGSNVYSDRIQLWHPTAFKGRVLYIAGIPEMTTYPFVLYSATNQDHSVRATRVELGSGVVPFDVFVRGDVVSVLARSPKAWTFYGSNDGETWTALDTRSNETGWASACEARDYSFDNDTAYLYYKYDCTALNGATDYLQVWELEFYHFDDVDTTPLLSTWSTYVFVAKIDVGAGAGGTDRVSIAVQPIAATAFSREWDWAVADVEANLVSGGTPVSYIAFAGQYQTGNYEVAIDQFKIATSLDLVCDRAAPFVLTVASTDVFHAGDMLP